MKEQNYCDMESYEAIKRQLEHETTALHMVHELLSSGMWSMEFDERGEMTSVYWSDEFRAMLGYQDKTDFPNVLESWSDLLHEEDKPRVMEEYYSTIADYTGNKTYDVEYRLLTKHRGWRWFQAAGKLSRRKNGTPITYVGIFVDITHQKQMNEALQTQYQMMEDALQQANQANQAKTVFLSNMSHDMRTPMNAIVGFTTLASMCLDNREAAGEYLKKIQTASDNLLTLINDVLDMSQIESGEMRINEVPVFLPDILQEVKESFLSEVRAKGLEFVVETDPLIHTRVCCDRELLKQVLDKVLSNAVKFTPSGGRVSLKLSEQKGFFSEQSSFLFSIQDSGIGIGPDFLPHIFDPFEREQTSTVSGAQGVGLGLTIAKRLVEEAMHGAIQVDSQQGKGTWVTISLPLRLSGEQ